ncbi:hypothetical protein [Flagellimonas sediminis]|uniref:Lipoprotein n=1 Tax=Flagellimonas sediminis TaxID=2696468 RepID=A0A6I5KMM9_9FLAO|nr:hypothetical protein [Allomuricauda sediminis]NDV41946.1 hypothetical protein [Allomuricauda sediminis]
MLKKLLFSVLPLMLIGCLLVSPIVPFLDKELRKTMVPGSAEEEKSSKKEEAEKNFDELDLYLKNFFELSLYQATQKFDVCITDYIFPAAEYNLEILDPPPKKLS